MRSFTTQSHCGRLHPRLTIPTGVSKVRLKGNVNWTFGGSGYRHVWTHQNGGPYFGMGRESDESDAGVQR